MARAVGEPLAQAGTSILFGEGAAAGLRLVIPGSMTRTFEALKSFLGMELSGMLRDVSAGGLAVKQAPEPDAGE